jgi:L-lysine 2,3-aminomutase
MELILLVVYTFIVWIGGAVSGWKAREEHARQVTEKFIDQMQQSDEDDDTIQITIEKHNDVFYDYDRHTNEFMAQGSSKQEVETNLKKRYPGKTFGCAESNLSQTGFYS